IAGDRVRLSTGSVDIAVHRRRAIETAAQTGRKFHFRRAGAPISDSNRLRPRISRLAAARLVTPFGIGGRSAAETNPTAAPRWGGKFLWPCVTRHGRGLLSRMRKYCGEGPGVRTVSAAARACTVFAFVFDSVCTRLSFLGRIGGMK